VPGQELDSLAAALTSFDGSTYDAAQVRHNAERFSPERFRRDFAESVHRLLGLPQVA
jgi:hypothetical protein